MRLTELIDYITREDIPLNPRMAEYRSDHIENEELSLPGDRYSHITLVNRYKRMRYEYQKQRRENARKNNKDTH